MMSQRIDSDRRLRKYIAEVQLGADEIDDAKLDKRLGLAIAKCEAQLEYGELLLRHGLHRLEQGDFSYQTIRSIFRNLPAETKTVVDLGSGYGRVCLYGGLLLPLSFFGIEILRERHIEAERVRTSLCLHNVSFLLGNAETIDWPTSECYLIMNSFSRKILPIIVGSLEEIARDRVISVFSVSTANLFLSTQNWLEEVAISGGDGDIFGLRLFRSQ